MSSRATCGGAIAVLASLAVHPSHAATQPAAAPAEVTIVARSVQPGELVIVAVPAPDDAVSVRVTVFGEAVAAYRLSNDWQAIVGVDLDQHPGVYTVRAEVRRPTTVAVLTHRLVVQPKRFAQRTLRVAPEFVEPPPTVVERIASEAAFVREAFARSSPDRLWHDRFVRPVPGAANSSFGTRSVFNGQPRSPHGGTDFMSGTGTPVKAPNAGLVVAAREMFFTGNTVIIDHGLGMFSTLAHLSRIDLREGDTVSAGQLIGLVGATGRVTGPHLHWALRVSGARVDPLSLLALLGDEGATVEKSAVE